MAGGRLALRHAAQVLAATLVGLQAGEDEFAVGWRVRDDAMRQSACGRAGATPQRPWPTSTSTNTSTVAPLPAIASASRSTPSAESTATASRTRPASTATRASLARSMTSLEMKMSAMPAMASASASLVFCTQTPTAPAAICSRAIAAHLCILACGRRRTPCRRAKVAMAARLRSIASRSMTSAGVSDARDRRADRDDGVHAQRRSAITPVASATTVADAHDGDTTVVGDPAFADVVQRHVAGEMLRVVPADQAEATGV